MNRNLIILGGLAAALLAGCGGGGGGDASASQPQATPDTVPVTANASAADMAGYITTLATSPSDAKDALDVSTFAPPTSDNTEPQTLQ